MWLVLASLLGCGPGQQQAQHPSTCMGLTPALTEILHAVLPDSTIVARTQACNWPPACLAKPVVNSYPLSLEQVLDLGPQVIFAEEGMAKAQDLSRLQELGLQVHTFRYDSLAQVWASMETVGRTMGHAQRAQQVADSLRQGMAALAPAAQPMQAVVCIGLQPLYAWGQGSLMDELLSHGGMHNAVDSTVPGKFPILNREWLLLRQPQVVLGCTAAQLLQAYPEMAQLEAVKAGRVFPLPPDVLVRPGPRLLQGARWLRHLSDSLKQAGAAQRSNAKTPTP